MATKTVRIVSREVDGSLRIKDLDSTDSLNATYEQIGVDDCSTELTLRGFPVYRGLIGPIAEGKRIARYETTEVFEMLTKEWAVQKIQRRRLEKPALPAVHFPLAPLPVTGEFVS